MSILLVLDTETTSRYPDRAKVLELAAVVIKDGAIQPECFETRSNPGYAALQDREVKAALEVNGIKMEEIAVAPTEEKAKEKFLEFLKPYKGVKVTSFNIWYDRNVLNNGNWLPEGTEWGECIMLAATDIMGKAGALPYDRGKRDYKWASLVKARDFFEIKERTAHKALDDALVAAEVWLRISEGGWGRR